jgi:hypothetical protein
MNFDKIYYKHILSSLLVGKNFEDYRYKKVFNKFYLYDINFDYKQTQYTLDDNKDNLCFVIVKDGTIVKVFDIQVKN